MINDPFQRLGIEHLSPSSLNLWRSAPGLWSLRYLARIRDDGNAAMWRGSAVENGLAALLRKQPLEAAKLHAMQSFELNAKGEITDELEHERALVPGMVDQCARWTPPCPLNATQLKIEHWFDDLPIPVIGYLDFAFEDGIDVDLKTTKACPSKPRPDHVRQVALYRAARGRRGGLLYVTDKKHAYFDIDDDAAERALNDLEACARSLQAFLARMHSPQDAIRCLPMDRDHYAWSPKVDVALHDLLMAG